MQWLGQATSGSSTIKSPSLSNGATGNSRPDRLSEEPQAHKDPQVPRTCLIWPLRISSSHANFPFHQGTIFPIPPDRSAGELESRLACARAAENFEGYRTALESTTTREARRI